jgi:hypothetical protein
MIGFIIQLLTFALSFFVILTVIFAEPTIHTGLGGLLLVLIVALTLLIFLFYKCPRMEVCDKCKNYK